MKKYLSLTAAMFGFISFIFSQNVGIGTTNPLNKLHVAGGFRLDTLVSGNDSGLLRHNKFGVVYSLKFTGNTSDVLRGDGSFGAGSTGAASWLLNGNSGTTSDNFIGTTDNKPLLFRINNNSAGQLSEDNISYGILATTKGQNIAIGYKAIFSNTFGSLNTAVGHFALSNNTVGGANTVVGQFGLEANTGGGNNTGVGYGVLGATTNSSYNTAIGYFAGVSYDNGYNNVFVGADADANAADYYNVIAIGQGTICTAPSQVTLGNSATNSYRAYANWSNISDGRYKKDIAENVPGLAFIIKLRPVTYRIDATGIDDFLHKNTSSKAGEKISPAGKAIADKALREKEKIHYTGFVAQEVEKSAKELGFDFSGIDAPKNKDDLYGLRYSEFVVPLVKAVQEQQSIIEKQQKQIDDLLKQLQSIKEKLR